MSPLPSRLFPFSKINKGGGYRPPLVSVCVLLRPCVRTCPVVIPSAEQTNRKQQQNRKESGAAFGSVVLGGHAHRKQSDNRGGLMIAEDFRRQNKNRQGFVSLLGLRSDPVRCCFGSGLRFLSASPWIIAAMIDVHLGNPVCSCGFLYALCAFCHCSV